MNNNPQPQADRQTTWNYHAAFARNLGLVTPEEQEILRTKRVAIAGMGGVGGVHLVTLARLGVGRFTIADPDRFELANFNRQYGAQVRYLGRNKAEVMAEEARQINPELEITVLTEPISPQNVDAFLEGADAFLDGIDFFAFDTRALLFRRARQRGLWAVTAGPIGFSTAWLVFDPKGMSFDDYFAFREGMGTLEKVANFLVGLAPRATHLPYTDLSYVDPATGRGPSAGLACQLCAGVAAADVLKILLGRGGIKAVPWYGQFDAYRGILRRGRLLWGVRGPWQTIKRRVLVRRLNQLGLDAR
jgi:hypothetical protein